MFTPFLLATDVLLNKRLSLNESTESGNREKKPKACFDRECFRAVFLANRFDAVRDRPECARRVFLGGLIIFTTWIVFISIYMLGAAMDCYTYCKFNGWIPSYLLLAGISEIAHLPGFYVWCNDRDPDDLSFDAFDIYRLASWVWIVSVAVFGSIVVYPNVRDFDDVYHHRRHDQCPCFYWSFWWVTGTWFSLLANFSFNWLMYRIRPSMYRVWNRITEKRERMYYERLAQYNEERMN